MRHCPHAFEQAAYRRFGHYKNHGSACSGVGDAFVYVAATEGVGAFAVDPSYIAPLVCVGILHTGIAYILFYEAISVLDAQKFAIFSYADPIVALAASALILHEVLEPAAAVGALLILGVIFADGIADSFAAKRE